MNLTFLEGQLTIAYLHEGLIFLGTMGDYSLYTEHTIAGEMA
jgi:hypothetical protein